MRSDEPALVRLTLRALPDAAPAAVRLRRLLKTLIRCYGFRCLQVEEVRGLAPGAGRPTLPPCGLAAGGRRS